MYGFIETATSIPSLLSAMSKGDAMKWYQPETDCYLKANRVDHGREYQDAIAEVIASRVGELLHILVVQYQLCRIRINDETFLLGTISHNFCHKNESFISFETMVESSDEPIQWAPIIFVVPCLSSGFVPASTFQMPSHSQDLRRICEHSHKVSWTAFGYQSRMLSHFSD